MHVAVVGMTMEDGMMTEAVVGTPVQFLPLPLMVDVANRPTMMTMVCLEYHPLLLLRYCHQLFQERSTQHQCCLVMNLTFGWMEEVAVASCSCPFLHSILLLHHQHLPMHNTAKVAHEDKEHLS